MKALRIYELRGIDMNLLIMGRPWLSADNFKVKMQAVTDTLDLQIEKEITSKIRYKKMFNSEKALNLKSYEYANIYMNNYGDPILDKENNLIGYKLNYFEHASVNTYYNDENKLCNKISIQEFDLDNLSFKGEPLNYWIDIRTESGFIREYKNLKYFSSKMILIITWPTL